MAGYEEYNLDYETTYGHCMAKNPYWFIPDLECNTEKELLSWRHALFAVKQGTFESPEHYFWKTIDTPLTKGKAADMMKDGDSLHSMPSEDGKKFTVHGHNTTWGMGISAFSDKINVWEKFPSDKWLIKLAESDVSDNEFLAGIKAHNDELERMMAEYRGRRAHQSASSGRVGTVQDQI